MCKVEREEKRKIKKIKFLDNLKILWYNIYIKNKEKHFKERKGEQNYGRS